MASSFDATDLYLDAESESVAIYRAVSRGAVFALVAGIVSLLSFISSPALHIVVLGPMGAAAIVAGVLALRQIRRYPDEVSGKTPALAGMLLGSLGLVGGTLLHVTIYVTEVPEGYTRISFRQLQPDAAHPDLPVPPEAIELNGERVFIKGYLYPDGQRTNIKQFVLVPDLGTCCFGGQPKLTDMIEVTLRDPYRTDYSFRQRKLGGILKVDTRLKPISGVQGVYYQLEADYLQ